MIKCNNVSVAVNGNQILKGVCCEIPKGKFTAIIGNNGSGKTTLVNSICSHQPYSGSITINGIESAKISQQQLATQVSYLPQKLNSPAITVIELVSMGRVPYIGLQRKLNDIDCLSIQSALEKTGMLDFAHRMVSNLSGGERQKAFLSMILAQETDILILDEPNTFMDAGSQSQFLKFLKKLTLAGKTVVAVLHDLSLATYYADHIIVLDHGNCVYSDTKEQCLQDHIIEREFHVNRYNYSERNEIHAFFK